MSAFRLTVVDPAAVAAARTAIVVPARNEARRIERCLRSLAAQRVDARPAVYLCVNNTSDATAAIACETARRTGLALVLAEVAYRSGGVGRARRIGHALVARHGPASRMVLSTDADCIADPGWVGAMEAALRRAPAVIGRLDVTAAEAARFPRRFHAIGRVEAAYMRLSVEFERLLDPGGESGIGINTACGGNLGLRIEVYREVGGFRALPHNEDRDLFDRIAVTGRRPEHAPDAVIFASMRATGRAERGMAAGIADRLAGEDCALHTALAPFDAMLARHLEPGALSHPITVGGALRDMSALGRCVCDLRGIECMETRHRHVAALSAARATATIWRAALPSGSRGPGEQVRQLF